MFEILAVFLIVILAAAVVAAVTAYKKTMHQLSIDLRTIAMGAFRAGGLNHKYIRHTLTETESALGKVEAQLEMASRSPGVYLEQCLACWEIDFFGCVKQFLDFRGGAQRRCGRENAFGI